MPDKDPRRWRAKHLPRLGLLAALLCLTTLVALAQSGGAFDLSWNTIDAGGATLSLGDHFSLSGTAGQPDAGEMSGGVFSLAGGFWPGAAAATDTPQRLFLPLLVRNARVGSSD